MQLVPLQQGARASEEGKRIALRRREEEAACSGGGGVLLVRLEAPRNNLISESLSQFSRNFKSQSVTLQPQTPSPTSDVGVAINRGGVGGISGSSSGGSGGGGGGGMRSSMWDNLSPPSSPESADAARRGAASPPSTFGNTTSFATATSGDGVDHCDLVEDSEVF